MIVAAGGDLRFPHPPANREHFGLTWISSLRGSPRMRSAPQSEFFSDDLPNQADRFGGQSRTSAVATRFEFPKEAKALPMPV